MADEPTVGIPHALKSMTSLKWALLRGAVRGGTQQKLQVGISLLLSLAFGLSAILVLGLLGQRSANADAILVLFLPVSSVAVGLLSAATGVEATIDVRHLGAEPFRPVELATGMLGTAAIGPPGLLAFLAAIGAFTGWYRSGIASTAVLILAIVGWLLTLLMLSRTLANVLGAWATGRFRQIAQALAASSALIVWLGTQIFAGDISRWDRRRLESFAEVARWTPPGQLGEAVAADRLGVSLVHLLLGYLWFPVLLWAVVASTRRLVLSSPRPGGDGRRMRTGNRGLRRGLAVLPEGPSGAVAARTLRTKLRTPRQAVNTLTALVVGAGVFLIAPILQGDVSDPRLVMVGGLLQFAVIFDGNNSFGVDGPAIWTEISAGADAAVLVRAKVMSSLVVMALPILLIPLGLAAIVDGWAWLPATWLLAVGSVLASSGVAVAAAALAPVAMPESPNPLASGDTGQGCLAGLMLTAAMATLGVVTAPVAVVVLLASTQSAALTTAVALSAPLVGAGTMWAGGVVATRRLAGREAELVQRVTPAR